MIRKVFSRQIPAIVAVLVACGYLSSCVSPSLTTATSEQRASSPDFTSDEIRKAAKSRPSVEQARTEIQRNLTDLQFSPLKDPSSAKLGNVICLGLQKYIFTNSPASSSSLRWVWAADVNAKNSYGAYGWERFYYYNSVAFKKRGEETSFCGPFFTWLNLDMEQQISLIIDRHITCEFVNK